jgi:hypothetical protein
MWIVNNNTSTALQQKCRFEGLLRKISYLALKVKNIGRLELIWRVALLNNNCRDGIHVIMIRNTVGYLLRNCKLILRAISSNSAQTLRPCHSTMFEFGIRKRPKVKCLTSKSTYERLIFVYQIVIAFVFHIKSGF